MLCSRVLTELGHSFESDLCEEQNSLKLQELMKKTYYHQSFQSLFQCYHLGQSAVISHVNSQIYKGRVF